MTKDNVNRLHMTILKMFLEKVHFQIPPQLFDCHEKQKIERKKPYIMHHRDLWEYYFTTIFHL